ncbi:SDR family NAD(P)-dependent oxidoreductase [Rhizobium sullae]|uniref:NAD(P)-dependent dehydrogenase (Short-subunit alcohol dehydrogenase family) n=1 Tax=Rhizobium sullae TaxID=50338 RepID=A0A4R3Q6X2_RHISU|nr:SDR family NAD(P)-dependent oxidoreductase [Rhizobium sullae]TCU13676.1 NAD(P)-dependent dehydrogenase (short-subunit alcohol dehydrogenase family) [Rhizobium sullae]
MSGVFITGSSDGLGLGAARALIDEGHDVILHARSNERAASALSNIADAVLGVVIGDLSSAEETRSIADQVNAFGRMDAVIHNAGVYHEASRGRTPEGHAKMLAVNVLAPFILTSLIKRPERLIYLSSGMHRSGGTSLEDIDWMARRWNTTTAYCESKLYVATLAAAVARLWPDVVSSSLDPGWVPTKMGGAGAPDDLEEGHLTQTWLAVSQDEAATVSGKYWYHRRQSAPAAAVNDPIFQDRLLHALAKLTEIAIT